MFDSARGFFQDALVCVLIDEVESLTAARSGAVSGAEPSDAVRVVNAVLTQIDQLKRKDNVLILTTSNISESIDLAFVDRADVKQYIGLPSTVARYTIIASCVSELVRAGIIRSNAGKLINIPCFSDAQIICAQEQPKADAPAMHLQPDGGELQMVLLLMKAACEADGLSGRALRKLPFQAHAFFANGAQTVTPTVFAGCILQAVKKELNDRRQLRRASGNQ